MQTGNLYCSTIRLHPGDDLTEKLRKYVELKKLKSAFIITCVGSVTEATLRLADATSENHNPIIKLNDKHEIVSLVGTICKDGFHLHTSLSDVDGKVVGGHLVGNMKIFTTAEIVIGNCPDIEYTRKMDHETGFNELVIKSKSQYNM